MTHVHAFSVSAKCQTRKHKTQIINAGSKNGLIRTQAATVVVKTDAVTAIAAVSSFSSAVDAWLVDLIVDNK